MHAKVSDLESDSIPENELRVTLQRCSHPLGSLAATAEEAEQRLAGSGGVEDHLFQPEPGRESVPLAACK